MKKTPITITAEKKSTKNIKPHHRTTIGTFMLIIAAVGFVAFEGNKRTENLSVENKTLLAQINILSAHIDSLESGFATTTETLEENIVETQDSFAAALQKEKQNVTAFKEEFGTFQEEVDEIAGFVTTLEKLSKTDPELLQKYSKVFFLNEHYEPPRLTVIPEPNRYNRQKTLQIDSQIWPYLQDMLQQAEQDNVKIFVSSAFRSFDTQEALKGQYTVIYGAGTANQFSADQGYSEHQLGTTVDLITTGIGGTLSDFETTNAYTWLLNNAHRYGFVLSYPKNNSFYIFEPWHWRFVGVDLAAHLHDTNQYFYDLDQREIDEYLVSIFD